MKSLLKYLCYTRRKNFTRKIWRFAENKMLPHIEFMMTESESYAKWFHEKKICNPVVVRNILKNHYKKKLVNSKI